MFAIQPPQKGSLCRENGSSAKCCTPNILPCRIHHDGPVEMSERYWKPVKDEKGGIQTAHFRGRRLRGRRVTIPEGYQGIVAVSTDRVVPPTGTRSAADDLDAEPEEPVRILEQQAMFDEFVVWGHEAIPAADDPYVKGVEEWLKFAEVMHSSTASSTEDKKNSST